MDFVRIGGDFVFLGGICRMWGDILWGFGAFCLSFRILFLCGLQDELETEDTATGLPLTLLPVQIRRTNQSSTAGMESSQQNAKLD